MGRICKCKQDYHPKTLEEILEAIHGDAVLRKHVENVIKEKGLYDTKKKFTVTS